MGTPPTGKTVAFPLMIIYRLEGGKIVQHWMLVDMLSFMQQIGAMPEPAAAAAGHTGECKHGGLRYVRQSKARVPRSYRKRSHEKRPWLITRGVGYR
jgi:hypothetical protein